MAESSRAVLVPHGTPGVTSDATLTRLAGGFLASKRSPNTRHAYDMDLRQFFRWCRANGLDPLLGMERTYVEVYARHNEDRGLAPSTRQRRLTTVRGWYEWLTDEGHYQLPNPVRRVALPRVTPVTERAILTKREMHVLLRAAENDSPSTWATVALGYVNGLRISETLDVDVNHLGKVGWHHVLRIRGKGEKHDEVALLPAAAEALTASIGGRQIGPAILSPYTGDRLRRRPFGNTLERLCRDNRLTRITPHGLRRTAITILLQDGVPLREVQVFARHADPATTASYDVRTRALDEHLGSVLLRAIA